MANGKEIKRRIKSVKNTKKITKAMELVAASKMRKVVSSTLSSRPYATYSEEIIKDILSKTPNAKETHFLLRSHNESNKILVLLVTSNRGLCGAYNAQVLRTLVHILKDKDPLMEYEFLIVGKKGESSIRRLQLPIIASFTNLPENITYVDTVPIANIMMNEYESGKYREVYVLYTDFITALTQKAHYKKVLPLEPDTQNDKDSSLKNNEEIIFEPNMEIVFNTLVHKVLRIEVFQMLLESIASEQSSRMVAMKNATEAAGEMINDLTLVYNKARQASITKEISEISAGMASVS